jgi:hypothetical protein
MKTFGLRSFALPLFTLMAVSVVVAQTLPESNGNKVPARRTVHHHLGPPPHASGRLGDPLPNLTQDQVTDFSNGLDEFENVETVASGLGPVFNNTSCANCHSNPVIGGASALLETRFGRSDNKNGFDPLIEEGGSLLQNQAIDPACLERIPADANVIAQRKTTPIFGLGLIEAIPDSDIEALARNNAKKPDGVLGRAAIIQDVATGDTRVGRFGSKAHQATLLAMAADAYVNEMGITNRLFPVRSRRRPRGHHRPLHRQGGHRSLRRFHAPPRAASTTARHRGDTSRPDHVRPSRVRRLPCPHALHRVESNPRPRPQAREPLFRPPPARHGQPQ